ncbi:MAG TPA: hypothetical protein VES40_19340 [Ilumatobacteraceae bacterium]|nr:hypothetical protein [Ilumatobacteraceae bacterium]
MTPGIVIPLVVLAVVLVGAAVWYQRSMVALKPDDAKPVSGARLTAETLHRLDSPPWRVVYEIGRALGGVDHVIIGPPGVIAVTTIVADRPTAERLLAAAGEAQLTAEAAIERGPADELVRAVGITCRLSARVFWGTPDPDRPAFDGIAPGNHLVEGQRLMDWLEALDDSGVEPPITQAQIDLAWQAIVMGIGRPDPLR